MFARKYWPSPLSISSKIIITSIVGVILFLCGFLVSFLPYIEDFTRAERRHFLSEKSATVLNLLQQYEDDVKAGRLSIAEAQERATRRVRGMVFSKGDYFWIMTDERPYPKLIMHPMGVSTVGKVLDDAVYNRATAVRTDYAARPSRLENENLFKAMADICARNGSGYVDYDWPKPLAGGLASAKRYPKESYVVLFKPWGWIIGTGEYVDDIDALIGTLGNAAFFYLGLAALVSVALAIVMASSIIKPLRRVVTATKLIAAGDFNARSGVSKASDELEQLASNFDHMAHMLHKREEERREALASLSASENKFRIMVEHMQEFVGLLSPEGMLLQANPAALAVIGAQPENVVGKPYWDTPWWYDDPNKQLQIKQALEQAREKGQADFSTSFAAQDGRTLYVDFSVQAVFGENAEVLLYIAEGRDITEHHEMENKLRHMALHDSLTGLANRALLLDRINQAILSSHREPWSFAVLFIDIDRFKVINDSLGHCVGDKVLKSVATRFKRELRDGDTLARYGGDEFVALVKGISMAREAIRLSRRLLDVLAKPIIIGDESISIQASIGIEFNPPANASPDELIRNANLAMHNAKKRRNGRPMVFTSRLLEDIKSLRVMEQELPAALENGQLQLFFQPIIDVADGVDSMGFEALCRWFHPELGHIPPMKFIGMAEETGFISRLGEWVLDKACRSLAVWNAILPNAEGIFVSVNVSPKQFIVPGFPDTVRKTLERHRLKSGQLHLEITETAIMESTSQVLDQLNELVKLGVRLSIDDFGTGYSNLALLTRLPVSDLKIDLSIVMGLEKNPTVNTAVIRTIVNMAQALNLIVVAEGVETPLQRDMLLALGCCKQQGYLHARPMDDKGTQAFIIAREKLE